MEFPRRDEVWRGPGLGRYALVDAALALGDVLRVPHVGLLPAQCPVRHPGDDPEDDATHEGQAAIWYWIGSRPVHGVTKNPQSTAPTTGRNVGVTKCGRSLTSLRRTSTQMLTIVKTPSSSSAVVPPRAPITSPVRLVTR